jgi:ABC-type polysaccharide/polyol phosphate export permease
MADRMTSERDVGWLENGSGRQGRFDLRLGQLWRHRELALFFAYRDIKVRYKQALLGGLWAVLQPLIGALMFTIVFHRVADIEVDGTSYFAFAVAGFATWNYVSSAISNGTGSLLYNGELLTKVAFPRLIIPVAAVLPGLIDLSIGLSVAVVASLATGGGIDAVGLLVGLPAGVVLLVLTSLGGAMFLSAKVVKYRDVLVLVTFGLQVMLFLTPIAYPPEQLPIGWRTVAFVNPIAGAVGLIRWAVSDTAAPTAGQLAISAGVAVAVALLALISFRAHEREFADVI